MNTTKLKIKIPIVKILFYFLGIFLLLNLLFLKSTKAAAHGGYIKTMIQDDINGVVKLQSVSDIEVVGDYLYAISATEDTFSIFDVTDPESPDQIGILTTASPNNYLETPQAFFIEGDYAYVVSYTAGEAYSRLNIIDISDKENPTLESTMLVDDVAVNPDDVDIFVSGDYAYLTSQNSDSVSIIDISNPISPFLESKIEDDVNGFDNLDGPQDLLVNGNYLYVTTQILENVINIIDVSDPSSPALETLIEYDDYPTGGVIKDISIKDDNLFVLIYDPNNADGHFLEIYDISTPATPTLINALERDDYVITGHLVVELDIEGDMLYFSKQGSSNSAGSLAVFNMEDLNNPKLLTELNDFSDPNANTNYSFRVSATNGYVYLTAMDWRIIVLGGSDLNIPNVYDKNLFPSYTSSTYYGSDFAHIGNSTTLTSVTSIPIDSSKTYRIKGEFRGKDNTTKSRIYLGFAEYDKHRALISSEKVHRISPTTDAVTFSSISNDRLTLTMTGSVPSSWCNNSSDTYYDGATRACTSDQERSLAIYLDGNLNKLPDFIYTYTSTSSATITLTAALPEFVVGTLNSSTKFLNHGRSATYNYSGANYQLVGEDWTSFSGSLVTGEQMIASDSTKFREGTKYIKPIVLANFGQTGLGTELYIKNISVVEVDAYGNEITVNIPTITNQNVKPEFKCENGGFLLMTAGTNSSLVSAEGSHTISGYCQDPITAEKESRSVTYEIDKTAPSAPTWDAISSGTYSIGQSVFVTPSSNHSIVFYGAANSQTITYFPFIDGGILTSDGASNRTYQINVRQYDPAGNLSSATSTRSYTITP